MKKTICEAKKVDRDYEDFKEFFVDNFMQENKLEQGSVIKKMLENQVGGKWLVYNNDHRKDYLALNVKWLGMGNWDAFNANGRAEKAGIDEQQYYDILQEEKERFFQDMSESWNHVEMYAMGRSGGYWGVELEQLVRNNYFNMFEMNDDKVRELRKSVEGDSDDPYDQAYDAYLYVGDEEIPEYFRLRESFCQLLKSLQTDVEEESARWEGKEWNDELFERYAM